MFCYGEGSVHFTRETPTASVLVTEYPVRGNLGLRDLPLFEDSRVSVYDVRMIPRCGFSIAPQTTRVCICIRVRSSSNWRKKFKHQTVISGERRMCLPTLHGVFAQPASRLDVADAFYYGDWARKTQGRREAKCENVSRSDSIERHRDECCTQ